MNKIFKVGVIGCGGIATGKHLPSLSKLAKMGILEIVAVCDIVEERAIAAKKDFGTENTKVYTDYQEVLKDKSIDTVHVLTPNRMHGPITVDALYADKHVMCEKPMAKTAEDARKMVEAAEKTGKTLTIGYQNRFRDDSLHMKKMSERGDFGDIYFAKAHAIRRRAVPTWGVFTNEYEQGGGSLIDIGTHALDLTLWMMDNYKPKSVMGTAFKKLGNQTATGNLFGDWDADNFTVEDSAFGYIKMENGATIFLESSWALNTLEVEEGTTTICGTKAGADMHDGLRVNGTDLGRLTISSPDFACESGVAYFDGDGETTPADLECASFYNCLTTGEPPVVLPRQALVVTEILEAIYKSSESGQAVYFD